MSRLLAADPACVYPSITVPALVRGGRALVGASVHPLGVPVQPASLVGIWNLTVSPEPSALARAIAQRREKAVGWQPGARSLVVVTISVVAAATGRVGAARMGAAGR